MTKLSLYYAKRFKPPPRGSQVGAKPEVDPISDEISAIKAVTKSPTDPSPR
jgi:hypothetical protein